MTKTSYLRALVVALAVYATRCAAVPTVAADGVPSAVQAVKTAVVQAYVDLDDAALERLYTDDFTVADGDGDVRSKADELAYVRSKPEPRLVSGRYELRSVRVFGDIAVGAGRAEMTLVGPNGSRTVTYRSFNVFRLEDGRWRYAAAFTP